MSAAGRRESLSPDSTAVVVIGRNEAARLGRCLESVLRQSDQVVYVDSGSSDSRRPCLCR